MNETNLSMPIPPVKMNLLQNPPDHVAEFLDTKGGYLQTSISAAVFDSLDKVGFDPLQPQKLDPS